MSDAKVTLEAFRKAAAEDEQALRATIGESIVRFREMRGWPQTELARRASIVQGQLSRYEHATRAVSLLTLARVARALSTPAWTLLVPVRGEFGMAPWNV